MIASGKSGSGLLTAREVAEILRIPMSTVYFLADKGDLPYSRIGRSLRFPAESIDRLRQVRPAILRVLVIDDDATVRIFAKALLEPHGFAVAEAGTVAEGERLATALRFDALLVDLHLPDGNGRDLIQRLLPAYGLQQFVIITACRDIQDLAPVLDLGAICVMSKPLQADTLRACVETIAASSSRTMGAERNRVA